MIIDFMKKYDLTEAGGIWHPGRLLGKRIEEEHGFGSTVMMFPGEDHTIYWRHPGERVSVVCTTFPYHLCELDAMRNFAALWGFNLEIDQEPPLWHHRCHSVFWSKKGIDWRNGR